MKQVIFLGFYCKVYKKNPIAQIYIGDHMIDEIVIPEYYIDGFIKNNELFYTGGDVDVMKLKENASSHPKIFIYIIDDQYLDISDGLIEIKIKNEDSNYTNGFLSRSTLLFLDFFYILPYTLLEKPRKYIEKIMNISSKKYYKNMRKRIFNLKDDELDRYNFPLSVTHREIREILQKTAINLVDTVIIGTNFVSFFTLINEKKEILMKLINLGKFTIGRDCTYKIELKKYYNLWLLKEGNFFKNNLRTIRYSRINPILITLYDKYHQQKNNHENQRNNH